MIEELTKSIDELYRVLETAPPEEAPERILRKFSELPENIALQALVRLLVIEHTRAKFSKTSQNS